MSNDQTAPAMPEKQIILEVAPDTSQQMSNAQNALMIAESFDIDSPEMFEAASNEVKSVKTRLKEVIAKKESFTKPLNALKSQWIDFFRPAIETLELVEATYKIKMDAYFNEQEKLRLEEEAKNAEIARKEQARIDEENRIERERIEAEQRAERERIEAEERAKREKIEAEQRAERERIEAEKAKANKKEKDRLEKIQKELDEKQAIENERLEKEKAERERMLAKQQADEIEQHEEEVIFSEAEVQQQVVTTTAPKASGISRKFTYKAELVSKMDLIKAIAAGEVPDIYVNVDMSLLNKQAKALKEHMNIPGVKAIKESGIAVRTQ